MDASGWLARVVGFAEGLALVAWTLSCWLLLISMAPWHWVYMLATGAAWLVLRDWSRRLERRT